MKRIAKLWTEIRRPFGARSPLRPAKAELTHGPTFFRQLRGLFERPRISKSARTVVMLSAAFISFSGGTPKQALLTWNPPDTEKETDLPLQKAATSAMDQREGVIVVMDAQTGRIRASVNLEGAYTQAMDRKSTRLNSS